MKFEFGHHRQSKKQCSEIDIAAITDFIFCCSTNQSFKQPNDKYKSHKKDLAPFFNFCITKINFLQIHQIVLMGGGLSGFFFFFFFCLWLLLLKKDFFFFFFFCLWLLLLKKDFEGLIDVFLL